MSVHASSTPNLPLDLFKSLFNDPLNRVHLPRLASNRPPNIPLLRAYMHKQIDKISFNAHSLQGL